MKRTFLPIRYLFFFLLIAMALYMTLNMQDFNLRSNKYRRGKVDSYPSFLTYELDDEDTSLTPKLKLPQHNQEDSKLVKSLFSLMIPPSPNDIPYDFRLSDFETSQGQGRVVRALTNYKRGGFFVECGAGDGEFFSNTLFLEKHLGWTGLLIEADPDHSNALLSVHRKAWVAPACLSLNTSAYESDFEKSSYFLGKVLNAAGSNSVKVTCFPFYTFMLALNVTAIDYFSLDVEGHEVEIIETIPFDKIDITVLSVEFSKSRGGLLGVKRAMERNGYRIVMEVSPDDLIFVKKNHFIPQSHLLM